MQMMRMVLMRAMRGAASTLGNNRSANANEAVRRRVPRHQHQEEIRMLMRMIRFAGGCRIISIRKKSGC